VRRHFRSMVAIAVGSALSLSGVLGGQGAARGADASGDFIIRCFYNGNIATEDPIEAPASFNAEHLHAFFGNMASGATASNGGAQVPFPNITSGDDGKPATMESNGRTPATNCQDSKDTAGYWVPEPYLTPQSGKPARWLPGGAGGCSTNCSPDTNLYMRVYYIPQGGNGANQEIPDGSIMVAGYPAGCANVDGTEPDGCSPTGPGYPDNLQVVEYSCGADQGASLTTPLSAWPYDCTNYTDADDLRAAGGFSDGTVAFVRFPDCWNGQADFPAPNSPVKANGLPKTMVPGYVAPWIPYTAWQNYTGLTQRPSNDFAYRSGESCPQGYASVVQLEERLHLFTAGQGWGEPSACTDPGGIGWNTAANAENSVSATQSDENETVKGKPNDDGDANVRVGTSGTTPVWGFHKCVPASAPSPAPGVSTLSFACSHNADPNCADDIGIPGVTTGCSAAGGHCFVGAYPFGWETLHADYWQTWQESKQALDGNTGATDFPGDEGTFGDVIEDCVTGTSGSCGFITDTTPSQVYGSAGNP
jgi:Domain of unknown function (DUF1996)